MIINFNDRRVELDLEGWGDNGDDIQIVSAVYLDDETPVAESDIDVIQDEWASEIWEHQYERIASQAYDDWKNRDER